MKHFEPLMTHLSPFLTALVRIPETSEPASGSVRQKEASLGSSQSIPRYFFLVSSLPPRVIGAERMPRETRGTGTNQRFVRNILPETEPAESLLIAEVITPSGNWSSYPPHKHDADTPPLETALEETYYHRLNPPQGFAFQRVYTDDRSLDETVCVEDGDVVLVPRGYHPVGAPHGYDLYYLNVMAGPRRQWIFRNDPAHAWMLG